MRPVIYVIIVVALFFAPIERVRISQLMPIRGIAISEDEGNIVIKTDNDLIGKGNNVEDALTAMKKSTAAILYLDTTEYLFVSENALPCVEEMKAYLKASTRVCVKNGIDDIQSLISYVDAHGDLPKLREWDPKNIQKK